VHSPYSLDFVTCFYAAQSCAALMLSALILFWRSGSLAARVAMLLAVWLAALANTVAPFLLSIGYKPGPETLKYVLAASAALATLSAFLVVRFPVALLGALGALVLWKIDGFVLDSEPEQSALHLTWVGFLLGLVASRAPALAGVAPAKGVERDERSYVVHDTIVFAVATTLAALVCLAVMRKRDGTADEWAYTFQAAVFAKGRAFAQVPACQTYLQNFYVFAHEGRLFAQYTPGWPLFLVPFVWAHAVWMGAPVALGLLCVGVARLARSAMRGFGAADSPPSGRLVSAAGTWAAVLTMLGTSILINAASRYSHILAVAFYAWSLEALVMVATPGLRPAEQRRWGLVLGCAAALMVGTRPDMGLLGGGIAAIFVFELLRGRIGWRAFAAATAGFAFWAAFVLVILRLQIGGWFKTGYSLNAVVHPWNVAKYDMPAPNQWKYGFPLATGGYCWWPCSMALGLAGLAMTHGRSRTIGVAILLGFVVYIPYFEWLDIGQRGYDWGYGPRYQMPLLIPMAIGAGVALAPLVVAARERVGTGGWSLERGGPLALAVFAIVSGWARIVPLEWPTQADHVRRHAGLTTAIENMKLTDAIVIAQPRTTGFDALDVTTNLPTDLYPNQPTIIAFEAQPAGSAAACLRKAFPRRRVYTASGTDDIRIAPY
jgi:hypothetical protein